MRLLKTNTAKKIVVGPFLDKGDFISLENSLTVTGITGEIVHEHDDGSGGTRDAFTCSASAGDNDMTPIDSTTHAFYDLELTAANVNFIGKAKFGLIDADVMLPYWEEWFVVSGPVYDQIMALNAAATDANARAECIQTHIINTMYPDLKTILSDVTDIDTEVDTILAAVQGIGTAGGAAINKDVDADNSAGNLTAVTAVATLKDTAKVGTITGAYTDTRAVNLIYQSVAPLVNDLSIAYQFKCGGGTAPVSITWTGYVGTGTNRTVTIYAWDHVGGAWSSIGIIAGQAGTANVAKTFPLYARFMGTSAAELGKVYIKFTATAGVAPTLFTDQIYASYAVTARSVGYAEGAVWIDTNCANSGTESFVNGTADKPVALIADAFTIAIEVGLRRIRVINGSLITLPATPNPIANYTFVGKMWALDLASRVVNDCYFEGASVSGACTSGAGKTPHFANCTIAALGAVSTNAASFDQCSLSGEITLSEAGSYTFDECIDGIPGTASNASLIFTAGAILVGIRGWCGGLELNTLTDGNVVAIDGAGRLIINADCHEKGIVIIRGAFAIEDNATGGFEATGGTLTQTERVIPSTIKTAMEAAGSHLAEILGDTGTTLDGKINTIDTTCDLVEDILRNQMEVTDATGAVQLRADDSTTPLLAASVIDNSTTTTRTRLE